MRPARSFVSGDALRWCRLLLRYSLWALVLVIALPLRAQIPAAERAVLLQLYANTNGAGWTNSTGWNGAIGTECAWYGISCIGTNVSQIQLGSNHLVGGPLPSLAPLTALQAFSVHNNQVTGGIPALTGLVSLVFFTVGVNQLTGPLPSLSGLTSLQGFSADFNQLTGPLPSLVAAPVLQDYFVDDNQLTGSIPALAGVSTLVNFGASANQLTGAIPSLTGLANLQSFDVSGNQLTGGIPPLAGLASLQDFKVTFNQLTGSIPALAGLTNLKTFFASFNQLTGSIPALTGLTNLQRIDVGFNQLSGNMPSLGGLANLLAFICQANNLSGPIAGSFGLPFNPGQSSLAYNGLVTNGSAADVNTWILAQGSDWRLTQTIPPTNLAAAPAGAFQADLTWTPIAYTADPGGYQVLQGTTSGGPYSLVTTTANRGTAAISVGGLSPNTSYFFVLRAITNANPNNPQNTVISGNSNEASVTTGAAVPVTPVPTLSDLALLLLALLVLGSSAVAKLGNWQR